MTVPAYLQCLNSFELFKRVIKCRYLVPCQEGIALLSDKKSKLDFFDASQARGGSRRWHTHMISVGSLGRLTFYYMLQKFTFGKRGRKRSR